MLLGPLDVGLVAIALPSITGGREAGLVSGQLVMLVYLVVLTLAYVPFGRSTDRRSAAAILRSGLLTFAVGAMLVALADGLTLLLVGRALQGLGAAACVTSGQALVFAAGGSTRAGRGLGLVHVAVAVGMLAGPVAGGFVLERFGWQAVFLIEPPLALGAALLIRSAHDVALPRRARSSIRSMLRRRHFSGGLLLAILAFIAMSANMFLVPFLLQRPLGLTPSEAGVLMAIVPAAILLGAVPAGALADRYGSRWPSVAGLALAGLGILGFAASALATAPVVAALAAYGLGAALFQSPNNRAVLAGAPAADLGLASGLLGSGRQIGQIVGVIVSGALIGAGGGLDLASAYAGAFAVLGTLAAMTAALAVALER